MHNKTDDVEGDYHYCDVMIGDSQSMIGNLINNLYKYSITISINVQ